MSAAEPHLDLAHLRALCDAAQRDVEAAPPFIVTWMYVDQYAAIESERPGALLAKVFSCGWPVSSAVALAQLWAAVSPDVVRALLDRLERAEAAWLYLGDRLLGRDEVSDGELRGLCGGHHVGGPAFCDRCGGVMEGSL